MVCLLLDNYMEVLVLEVLNEVKDDYGLDPSSDEFERIQAITLNNLPPAYFTDKSSSGVKKAFLLDRQRRISVLAKIAEAVEIVRSESTSPSD